jgi:GrpB-like predicted nucleotidyltransferase (UPF0157 family)
MLSRVSEASQDPPDGSILTGRPSLEEARPMTEPVSPPTYKVTSEEEIQAHSIGGAKRHDAPVTLADYDPQWPALYAREEARIRSVLGDRVVEIHHTGSTSVPGLAAKPVIDITLVVPDSSDEPAYVPDMEAAGYRLTIREPEWFEHRLFKGPDTNVNLHVFSPGCQEIERMVGFRDWLRTHPEDRDLYLRTKRELSTRTWAYVQNYADAKTEVVEAIAARAGLPPRVD